MDFVPITRIKSKKITMDDDSRKALDEYAAYISERKGAQFEASDILTKVILDRKFEEQVTSLKKAESEKVNIKMPESAWDKLDAAETKSGLKADELIKIATDMLLKDKKFLGWRKGASSK